MKIEFRKIPNTKSEFSIKEDNICCSGSFYRESNKIVFCDMSISGQIKTDCDRCGEEFDLDVAEKAALKICDGKTESEDLDIIECQDHIVDFDEIANGEIASILSDYHYCNRCKNEGE
jgi:uncharacterized metal-binding protein YceD (DUF177 family)